VVAKHCYDTNVKGLRKSNCCTGVYSTVEDGTVLKQKNQFYRFDTAFIRPAGPSKTLNIEWGVIRSQTNCKTSLSNHKTPTKASKILSDFVV